MLPAKMRDLFLRSLALSRTRGLLQGRTLQVALDTTPIWGRVAVKETYNLLTDGVRQLLRPLARVKDRELAAWAEGQGYARYLATSLKGTAEIDWDEPTAREAFLAEIVAYGDGHSRQQFADAGRTLIARMPNRPARTHFPKEDFQIHLAAGT